MTDPRPRYKTYQHMLDAMVIIVDSILLNASEDMIEQDMVTIRRQIRSANHTLSGMIQLYAEGQTFAKKEGDVKLKSKLGFTSQKEEPITKQTDILKRYEAYQETLKYSEIDYEEIYEDEDI